MLVLLLTTCIGAIANTSALSVTNNSSELVRQKRDGGAITGSIGAAIIGSVITTASAVGRPGAPTPPGKQGGCHWAGTSPFCDGSCPPNSAFEMVARHSNRPEWRAEASSGRLNFRAIHHMQNLEFGKVCLIGTKALCCRGNAPDRSWAGLWETTWGEVQRCRVVANPNYGRCGGILHCEDTQETATCYQTWRVVLRAPRFSEG